MAITLNAQASTSGSTFLTLTPSAAIIGGDTLVLCVGSTFQFETWGVTDASGNTWSGSPIISSTHFVTAAIFVLQGANPGSYNITVTEQASTGKAAYAALFDFTGAGGFDVYTNGNGFGSTSESVGPTAATSVAGEAVVAMFQATTSQTWTAGAGYALIPGITNPQQMTAEYQLGVAVGTQTATATTLANASYDACIITIKPLTTYFLNSMIEM